MPGGSSQPHKRIETNLMLGGEAPYCTHCCRYHLYANGQNLQVGKLWNQLIQMNIADVLVVDDDIAVCRIVQRMLSAEHYQVQTSQSFTDAILSIERKFFDAYVVDYKLPDGSGLDVAERIRSKGSEAPIILMSGYDASSVALRAEKLRISKFIEKPFSRETICEAVKKAIGASRAASELSPVEPTASPTVSGGRSWSRFWQRPAKRRAS
jgi:CheY-like chemotaxis protein